MSPGPTARDHLEACWRAAVTAVAAGPAVERALSGGAAGRTDDTAGLVGLALGKAAVPMARAAERWAGAAFRRGLAVTKDGHAGEPGRSEVREAGHPVPDARSEQAGRGALAVARAVAPDERLLVLLSGGASSLLTCPLPGLCLDDLARATRLLLESGADIDELNCVRKHLTAVSGGRLARAAMGRRVDVLAISDVSGDRLDVIGSGPCAADPTTYADALDVVGRRAPRARWPEPVIAHLERGAAGRIEESVKPGDPALAQVRHAVVAANADARRAALREARRRGFAAEDLGEMLRGEARAAAAMLLREARRRAGDTPHLLVAGGETTVTVRGPGRGGRSQELALAAALGLEGDAQIALVAAGTDGTDGPTDAAGAFADGRTAGRARRAGIDAAACLERNDSYRFFDGVGGLLRSGPTGTNVMDLVLISIGSVPARSRSRSDSA